MKSFIPPHIWFFSFPKKEASTVPQVFKIGSYWVYFWSNENDPLEPVHVHVAEGAPSANATKIWITATGRSYLCNNNSRIPPKTLRNIMMIIEARSHEIISKWTSYFGSATFFCWPVFQLINALCFYYSLSQSIFIFLPCFRLEIRCDLERTVCVLAVRSFWWPMNKDNASAGGKDREPLRYQWSDTLSEPGCSGPFLISTSLVQSFIFYHSKRTIARQNRPICHSLVARLPVPW